MRIVLLLADGASYHEIQEQMETAATTIARWKTRYEELGVEGLATFPPRTASASVDCGVARQDPEQNQERASRWFHALDLA
jgi:transposase